MNKMSNFLERYHFATATSSEIEASVVLLEEGATTRYGNQNREVVSSFINQPQPPQHQPLPLPETMNASTLEEIGGFDVIGGYGDVEFPFCNMKIAKRRKIADKILAVYPNRIPVIIGLRQTKKQPIQLEIIKEKYLVPEDMTFGAFLHETRSYIRNRLPNSEIGALYGMVREKNIIPNGSQQMGLVYFTLRESDLFLYILLCQEDVFGAGRV